MYSKASLYRSILEMPVAALAACRHELSAALTEELDDLADRLLRCVDDEELDRLHGLAVLFVQDDTRWPDGELELLAAQGLGQDAEVHDTAAGDDELLG